MLITQSLICEDKKYHRNCRWRSNATKYPDEQFQSLKIRLQKAVAHTGIARRIVHDTQGTITTIKLGYNHQLYIQGK